MAGSMSVGSRGGCLVLVTTAHCRCGGKVLAGKSGEMWWQRIAVFALGWPCRRSSWGTCDVSEGGAVVFTAVPCRQCEGSAPGRGGWRAQPFVPAPAGTLLGGLWGPPEGHGSPSLTWVSLEKVCSEVLAPKGCEPKAKPQTATQRLEMKSLRGWYASSGKGYQM